MRFFYVFLHLPDFDNQFYSILSMAALITYWHHWHKKKTAYICEHSLIQGAKKIIFTACYSGKLKLAFLY